MDLDSFVSAIFVSAYDRTAELRSNSRQLKRGIWFTLTIFND